MSAAEIYIGVYVYGGIRGGIHGIRLMEVYGVTFEAYAWGRYTGYTHDGSARGIRWWMYTGYRTVGDHHMRY